MAKHSKNNRARLRPSYNSVRANNKPLEDQRRQTSRRYCLQPIPLGVVNTTLGRVRKLREEVRREVKTNTSRQHDQHPLAQFLSSAYTFGALVSNHMHGLPPIMGVVKFKRRPYNGLSLLADPIVSDATAIIQSLSW